MRYEILYIFGGVYVDTNIIWLDNNNDFNDLLLNTNDSGFFIGRDEKGCNGLSNDLLGASKNNQILKYAMDNIKHKYDNNLLTHQ